MNTTTRPALGKLFTLTATGEYARTRLAYTSGPQAGMIEIGMTDGTTRMITAADITPMPYPAPATARAIPVFPDAADGSSRPMGTCEKCANFANIITIVDTKNARYSCGEWYLNQPNRNGRSVKAPTKTICTDCYAA
ncbi:hypothetical protein [Streptomyces sp. NPDC018055]|uniref:hypothetical protein n=1 Tax=Streptomyces sp. NPDC018055 TaxID=3365038 RepID=UPI0037A4F37E